MKSDKRGDEIRISNRKKACMIEDGEREVCIDPSLPLLSLIGRKYTMLILGVIGNKGNRKNFNEILHDIPYSSSTIVSKRLKELMDSGIIKRETGGSRVNYSLTEFGQELRTSLLPLFYLSEKPKED